MSAIPCTGRRAWLVTVAATAAGALVCLPWSRAHAAKQEPRAVVIVSKNLDVTSIPLAKLRRCFLGRKVSLAGVQLVPFNHPPDKRLRRFFDEKVLDMNPIESQRYWINSMIRGGPRPPR